MNLARVEYYFADLLSVLESGRDANGETEEALRFIYGEVEEGETPPPPTLKLPPNLYFIGTVNVDETTHSFSPKVLDRAFSLEFLDVDLEKYTSSIKNPPIQWDRQKSGKELLIHFTRNNQFARIEKEDIRNYLSGHSEIEVSLQKLNRRSPALLPCISDIGSLMKSSCSSKMPKKTIWKMHLTRQS